MHLIELKIKGFDIPKTLPPAMVMPAAAIIPGMPAFRPPVALAGIFFSLHSDNVYYTAFIVLNLFRCCEIRVDVDSFFFFFSYCYILDLNN